jgi:adenylosuccinate lyase
VEIVANENMQDVNNYISPLSNRYGSSEMRQWFSPNNRYKIWRELWCHLAMVEQSLGLDITNKQIAQMLNKSLKPINYKRVLQFEREYKHDVMAHLKEFCYECPEAEPIIHLGATSCYITDNADILIMRRALYLIQRKLDILIYELSKFCDKYKGTITMAYTHLQPAQPTTVGKRGCMWLQDIVMDKDILDKIDLKILGCNGATGTQASFLELLGEDKTLELNKKLAKRLIGDEDGYMLISGQTYTRKVDAIVLDALSNIAQSLHKMCTDIRLLQGMHEICEPFGSKQVGSSAMAYKQNPIKCENVCSLSRHIISNTMTAKMNVCTQWLERTLDDSANRRMIIPETFIMTDHILDEVTRIIQGLIVNDGIVERHMKDSIPFITMENIIMNATKQGISRQEAHNRIRDLSVTATQNVLAGNNNNLLELIKADDLLGSIDVDIDLKKMSGMAEKQVEIYLGRIKK